MREGRVKAISDSDGVSYPWYGNTTETVTLVGPTNKISRFSVSMNDNFYPSVTWAVPVSDSNVPLLTRIKRDQSFTTWLVAMNTTTKEKIILQTIKWRMRVDIEVDPLQLLGQRARLVGRTQQEQPRILSRMEPIPPNALVKPNANDAQVLMWRPKRGPPLVVIPPKSKQTGLTVCGAHATETRREVARGGRSQTEFLSQSRPRSLPAFAATCEEWSCSLGGRTIILRKSPFLLGIKKSLI